MSAETIYISVVMPAFKAAYLREAIASILAQSYPYLELVIVDDASPEPLGTIVAEFDDSRIRYYRNEKNLGSVSLAQSWNHAVEYAHYDYLVLASDDDIYDPKFLEEMIRLIERYPDVDLFRSRVALIDGLGKMLHSTAEAPEWESVEDFIRGRIGGHREMFVPEFVCRRSVLTEIGGFVDFPSAWGSDSATWYSVARRAGVVCSNKVLFYFRMSGVNISSGGHIENKLKALTAYDVWLHQFVDLLNTDSADELHRRITPHFKEHKYKILLYTPLSELLGLLPKAPFCDKMLIVSAMLGKITAKFK